MIWFIVQRRHGHEFPVLCYDYLPPDYFTSYLLRLDRMPEGSEWRPRPLAELMALYRQHKADGVLPPPNTADPPREKPKQGVVRGEGWRPPQKPWPDLPPEPFPEPGDKQLKPEAGAYIPPDGEDRADAPG